MYVVLTIKKYLISITILANGWRTLVSNLFVCSEFLFVERVNWSVNKRTSRSAEVQQKCQLNAVELNRFEVNK